MTRECSMQIWEWKEYLYRSQRIVDADIGIWEWRSKDRFWRISVSRLRKIAQNGAQYKRILDLSQNGNKDYIIQEVKRLIPEQFALGTNELEILRAVHLVEIMGFITPLRSDVISERAVSDSLYDWIYRKHQGWNY